MVLLSLKLIQSFELHSPYGVLAAIPLLRISASGAESAIQEIE